MRRFYISSLAVGPVELDEIQTHHARVVLRLEAGDAIDLTDAQGQTAHGLVIAVLPRVVVRVDAVRAPAPAVSLYIASAVPKGDRADWLVEKLSEIGVTSWRPLRTARSVVHPEGDSKFDRWRRIAVEAAKQSKRVGVMRIDPLTPLSQAIDKVEGMGVILSTSGPRVALRDLAGDGKPITLFIGPEGGWTDDEEAVMTAHGLTRAALGPTILRVETAAVVAAGMLAALAGSPQ